MVQLTEQGACSFETTVETDWKNFTYGEPVRADSLWFG